LALDQEQMGQELGLSREWVSKLETGKEEPSERVQLKVEKIARERGLHFSESGFTPATASQPVLVGEGATEELREFSYRLKVALQRAETDAPTIAGRLGAPLARVEEWIQGQRFPRAREGRELATLLRVEVDWLIRGEGRAPGAHVAQEEPAPYEAFQLREIGVVSWTHAGAAARYEEMPTHFQEKVATTSRDKKALALRVEGDCMLPEIKPGDAVIFEPSFPPTNGNVVVAKLKDDGVMVRIYTKLVDGRIRLTTHRPDSYPAIDCRPSDLHWIYPVRDLVRRFRP
jgi:SOS-response transcriptional repressor LexA/transcriptional regulator with XRE-family HTH domain